MKTWLIILLLLAPRLLLADIHIAIIQGLGGEEKYKERFEEQVNKLSTFSQAIAGKTNVTVFAEANATRESVLAWFEEKNNSMDEDDRLGLFLIGHGSYDGHEYKFNLTGPDLTGEDINSALTALPATFQLLINTSSSSGALLKELEDDSRVLITATKSGGERNATRFGAYFISGLETVAADINKNDAISAKEAFDYAERMTAEFYESEGRLATEHPQLSGERASQFTLARLNPAVDAGDDAELARMLEQKSALDVRIEDLQLSKGSMNAEEYLDQLQSLLIEMAILQGHIDEAQGTE